MQVYSFGEGSFGALGEDFRGSPGGSSKYPPKSAYYLCIHCCKAALSCCFRKERYVPGYHLYGIKGSGWGEEQTIILQVLQGCRTQQTGPGLQPS